MLNKHWLNKFGFFYNNSTLECKISHCILNYYLENAKGLK